MVSQAEGPASASPNQCPDSLHRDYRELKPTREGVSELRIDYGPGYRVYFMQRGSVWVVLLAGGDKSTQGTDIKTAIKIAKEWKE